MDKGIASIDFIDSLYQTYGDGPVSALIISVTIFLAVLVSHLVNKMLRSHLTGTTVGALSLLTNITRAIIAIVVVFFLSENVFHVAMSGVVQALGVTTLVVSLGLQDLIKSVVAGVLIVAGNIVAVGDQVFIGEHRGEVIDIDWHQITMRDRDGVPHIIPNSELMSKTFMRATGKMACRHIFECDIAPGVNLQMVKIDIENQAANVLAKGGWNAPEYLPQVLFLGSTAFGTKASIRIFISDIEYATRAMDAVMIAISERGYLADCTHEVDPSWKQGVI